MPTINYRKADVDGFNIFFRQAGPASAPAILLLHGFRPQATCSAILFRSSLTSFMW